MDYGREDIHDQWKSTMQTKGHVGVCRYAGHFHHMENKAAGNGVKSVLIVHLSSIKRLFNTLCGASFYQADLNRFLNWFSLCFPVSFALW